MYNVDLFEHLQTGSCFPCLGNPLSRAPRQALPIQPACWAQHIDFSSCFSTHAHEMVATAPGHDLCPRQKAQARGEAFFWHHFLFRAIKKPRFQSRHSLHPTPTGQNWVPRPLADHRPKGEQKQFAGNKGDAWWAGNHSVCLTISPRSLPLVTFGVHAVCQVLHPGDTGVHQIGRDPTPMEVTF